MYVLIVMNESVTVIIGTAMCCDVLDVLVIIIFCDVVVVFLVIIVSCRYFHVVLLYHVESNQSLLSFSSLCDFGRAKGLPEEKKKGKRREIEQLLEKLLFR